ncbi:MAG: hypothetical protein M1510_09620 [Nitrospirae bacterium]|nr:hypothetical protein [Nitrospirota bacterium]MCL5238372.1 hypothetical protein [Nitrospirota bacterium]
MDPLFFDKAYLYIIALADYRVFDMYLCRILAFAALAFLLYLSRFVSSFYVKVFAVVVALVLYFFPELVQKFIIR